jgi:hypothetical protein
MTRNKVDEMGYTYLYYGGFNERLCRGWKDDIKMDLEKSRCKIMTLWKQLSGSSL